MRICGVEIKGSDAVAVIFEESSSDYKMIESSVKKIALKDSEDAKSVALFYKEFVSFIKDNKIGAVGIKKRNTKGKFAGGAQSFKIEGLIQLACEKTTLLASVTISKSIKENPPKYPEKLLKYQKGAFETGYALKKSYE